MFQIKSTIIAMTALVFFVQCASKVTSAPHHSSNEPQAKKLAEESSYTYFHFLAGEIAEIDNDHLRALQHYQAAYEQDFKSDTLKFKIAEQLVTLGRIAEAKPLIEDLDLDDADLYLLKARVASIELDMDLAIKEVDEALKRLIKTQDQRRIRETSLMKVALLSDARRYKESIAELKKFIKNDPNDEIAYYFLGKIYSAVLEKENAIKAFQKALRLRPGFTTAAKALGLQYELSGNVPKAIGVYENALEHSSQDSGLRQKLASLYLAEEQFENSLRHLKVLILENPNDPQLQLRTALIYFKLNQFEDAKGLFIRLTENDRIAHDRIYFYLGALHEQQDQYKEAVESFRRISVDSQYFVDSQLQIARLLSTHLQQEDRAIEGLAEATKLRPYNKELYLALAGYFERRSLLAESIRVMNQATRFIQKDEELHFVLGSFYDKAGDFKAGIGQMQIVLDVNPNHAHALNHIGYVYAQKDIKLTEAEKLLRKAVQLEPKNGFIVDSLGWLYYKKGDYKKAQAVLERATKLAPNEPVIMEHLADVYLKLGYHDRALSVYQEAAAITAEAESLQNEESSNPDNKERNLRILNKIATLESEQSF